MAANFELRHKIEPSTMDQLIIELRKFGHLSDGLIELLYRIVRTKRYKKGEYLLRAGMVDHYVWFIGSGLILVTEKGVKGKLVNWILEERDFVIATDSFELGEPSILDIYAVEDTIVWYISHEALIAASGQFPEFSLIHTAIHGKYRAIETEQNSLRGMPDLDRFEKFWNTRRHLFTRLKREDLASYLRMTLRMFDKARKKKGK
jgi:CRP/FNR family transcriptional regulator, anaerobic regulatory protein